MKRMIRLLAALLAVLLLSGCGEPAVNHTTQPAQPSESVQPTQPTQTTEPETQPPETTQPVTEPTEPTDPPPSLDPVTRLQSICWRTFPELLSLGEGKVLASRNYYDGKSAIVNSLDVLDVYTDEVLAQTQNSSPRELVEQCFPDGCFLLADPAEKSFYVYDSSLNVVQQFDAPNVEGYFSYDRKDYYYINHGVLYRMDVATGNRGAMTLEYDLRLESLIGVHPDRDILVARFYLSVYDQNCGVCVIDTNTGKLLLLSDEFTYVWFNGDTFYATRTNDTAYGNDLYFGSLSGGEVRVLGSTDLGGDTVNYGVLSGSDLMVRRRYVEEKYSYTTVFDLRGGCVSCDMESYDYEIATSIPIYLEQEQLIFGIYASGYDFAPVVIDPKVLSYQESVSAETREMGSLVDTSLAQRYLEEVRGPELPAGLKEVRQQADALEKTYGVSVLIGQQVLGHSGEFAAVTEDANTIAAALTTLDNALAQYPKGFLKQFRNPVREGGIYFCLTGKLEGLLDPVGMAELCGFRYVLTLDITDGNLKQTIHHELWHAIEMKLSTDTFETAQWNSCNPSGFTYYGRYDADYESKTKWTYAVAGADCHFVDSYARINGREDRARIMEYVMGTDAGELMRSNALRQKLQLMSAAIRSRFNTDGWTDVSWERFL